MSFPVAVDSNKQGRSSQRPRQRANPLEDEAEPLMQRFQSPPGVRGLRQNHPYQNQPFVQSGLSSGYPQHNRFPSAGRSMDGTPKTRITMPLGIGVQYRPGPGPSSRNKDRFVSLPAEADMPPLRDILQIGDEDGGPQRVIFEDDSEVELPGSRGRITVHCTCENLDVKKLTTSHRLHFPHACLTSHQEAMHGTVARSAGQYLGDAFYFDYGVIVFWGLTEELEKEILESVVSSCEIDPLDRAELEIDEFEFHYSSHERPSIQNDKITLNHKMAGDPLIKVAIAHALAQSTKLCIYEQRVLQLAEDTKSLPETLAEEGDVKIPRREINKLIGEVFIHRAAVNLLSSVVDVPDFFWSAPDSLQVLYKKVCEYLELNTRVQVLNSRCEVLQDLLNMLRDQQNQHHSSRLEWVVIWLIVVEVVVGFLECASLFGIIGNEAGAHGGAGAAGWFH